ncbi:MAG: fumarylacetoacetate hydrolase family protein [Promethearchaeota archaeon]
MDLRLAKSQRVGDHPELSLPVKGKGGAGRLVELLPTNVFCLGKNFRAHAREMGSEAPVRPVVFSKSPSNLIADGEPVVLPPPAVSSRVDHEVELCVVIGTGGRDIPREDAADHVFGFTVLNDVTARDVQWEAKGAGHPWFLSKNLATSCPVGPVVVPREDIPDLGALRLELRVNGEVRQRGVVRDLIFPVEEVVEFISSWMPLRAGDLIAMGTPAGVASLAPGDLVEAEIDGIGVLKNPVVGWDENAGVE